MERKENIVLSDRLQKIADLVPAQSRVADIGTDHGYLPIYLLQNRIARSVIACDIGPEPLRHAQDSLRRYGISADIDFRLGDGLRCISPDEADTLVIAGMGGETIASILSAAPWCGRGAHRLILQPMTKQPFLRAYLAEQGFLFLAEQLVYENRSYFPILSVAGGGEKRVLPAAAQWGGVLLDRDPLQGEALEKTITRLTRAADGLSVSGLKANREKAKQYCKVVQELRCRKEEWCHANSKRN